MENREFLKLTRVTPMMALRMKQIIAHSVFFRDDATVKTLRARGWVCRDTVWQYALTATGYRRYCEWRENKEKNYRHIALHNAIYLTGSPRTGSAFYFPAPGEKHAGEQVVLSAPIIGEMIRDGKLTYCEGDSYWFAEHSEDPENRSWKVSSNDLPF